MKLFSFAFGREGEAPKSKEQSADYRLEKINSRNSTELSQKIRIFVVEMALVGPRPPVPSEVAEYDSRDWLRLSGKPGLTGTWQIYGRSRVPFKEMVHLPE